jgi:hypothetical protein
MTCLQSNLKVQESVGEGAVIFVMVSVVVAYIKTCSRLELFPYWGQQKETPGGEGDWPLSKDWLFDAEDTVFLSITMGDMLEAGEFILPMCR